MASWTNPEAEVQGRVVLGMYEKDVAAGQRQLFILRATVTGGVRDPEAKGLTQELFDLLQAG